MQASTRKGSRANLVTLLFSDDVIPVVHPFGGTEPIIGSNPLACAVPSNGDPFLTDFTPCMTLPTYVRYTQRYDAELTAGVATDADGNSTVDPFRVSTGLTHSSDVGAINPGGQKGFGLLLMIDFLSGALVGADMGTDHTTKADANKGHLMIAIDPDLFGSAEVFKAAVSQRMDDIRSSRRAPGVEAIRMPREGSFARRKRALGAGAVSIDRLCWEDAVELSRDLGVKAPQLD